MKLIPIKDETKILEKIVDKVLMYDTELELKRLTNTKPIETMWDKLNHHEFTNSGTIINPKIDENLSFNTMEELINWKIGIVNSLKEEIKVRLTPEQYYLTQSGGIERPFTGRYYETNKLGVYSCVVCTQRVFSSNHKYNSKSGHATFWNHLPFTLNFKQDDNIKYDRPTQAVIPMHLLYSKPEKRVCCSNVQ